MPAKKKAAPAKAAKKAAPKAAPKAVAKKAPAKPTPRKTPRGSAGDMFRGFTPYPLKKGEPYMNDAQRAHFREILRGWKRELMEEVDRTVHHMQDEAANFPDPNDRATQESEFSLELRTRDRERKLIAKIDDALSRLEEGSYGFCEETNEPISLRRLEARPIATLSIEAQERHERMERTHRDD